MQPAFRLRTALWWEAWNGDMGGPGDLKEDKTTLVHTPSFRLSGRLPLGPGSCQGRAICIYYEAALAGEPAGPWGEATAFLGCPVHGLTSVGEASFPPPLTPELQGCGLESSQWGVQILWAWWDYIQGGKLGLVVEAGVTGACGLLSGDLGPGVRRDSGLKLPPLWIL